MTGKFDFKNYSQNFIDVSIWFCLDLIYIYHEYDLIY